MIFVGQYERIAGQMLLKQLCKFQVSGDHGTTPHKMDVFGASDSPDAPSFLSDKYFSFFIIKLPFSFCK